VDRRDRTPTAEDGVPLGIHAHNDTGCAVANTLARSRRRGHARPGHRATDTAKRTGNAELISVIANLELKYGWPLLPAGALREATRLAHEIAEVTNAPSSARQPYVGLSSFAHKAGLHASAIKVDPNLYQHIDPALVGNDMRMLVSDMAGRANIQIKGEELGFDLSDRELAARITDRVKDAEAAGYTYEAADASFELLLRRELDQLPEYFSVQSWRVFTQSKPGEPDRPTECTVRLTAKGSSQRVVGEGNGPVNALDHAVRNALTPAYPVVEKFELIDYRVRILDQGHGTTRRCACSSRPPTGSAPGPPSGSVRTSSRPPGRRCATAYLYGLIHSSASGDPKERP
jgi:2-isopropylmalate synthase